MSLPADAATPSTGSKATLDPNANYLTFINTFQVEPENADRLLEALRTSTEELFVHQPGFISANLHVSHDRSRIVNYAQWRSKEDYDRMSQDPAIRQHMMSIAGLARSFDPVNYELREVVLARSGA